MSDSDELERDKNQIITIYLYEDTKEEFTKVLCAKHFEKRTCNGFDMAELRGFLMKRFPNKAFVGESSLDPRRSRRSMLEKIRPFNCYWMTYNELLYLCCVGKLPKHYKAEMPDVFSKICFSILNFEELEPISGT